MLTQMQKNWDIVYPKYKLDDNLTNYENYKIMIEKYYDEYYKTAEEYEKMYNNIIILDSDSIINDINNIYSLL